MEERCSDDSRGGGVGEAKGEGDINNENSISLKMTTARLRFTALKSC